MLDKGLLDQRMKHRALDVLCLSTSEHGAVLLSTSGRAADNLSVQPMLLPWAVAISSSFTKSCASDSLHLWQEASVTYKI